MRFLSCFSGIEAASLAWAPLGWECAGVAEVEPFASAVLAHHYPDVPNLGDVTADDFLQRVSALRPDVLVGGPPCQDFSVAGLRAGLGGDRGNLSLRWVEIIRAIRPSFAVTENVPGWLSVNKGHAFGAFLAGLVGHDTALVPPRNCGGRWTNAGMVAGPVGRVAWRVLDAQYFGLAQRRQRVFAVFCPRNGADPAAVLFEPACLQGHSPPRREAGEGTTGTLSSRATAGGGLGTDFDCSGGLVAHALRAEGFDASEDGTGRGTPLVAVPLQEIGKRTGVSTDDPRAGIGIGQPGDPMFTLQAGAQHGVLAMPALADPLSAHEGSTYTHEGKNNFRLRNVVPVAVAFSCKDHGADAGDLAPTMRAMNHSGSHANAGGQLAVALSTDTIYGVRHADAKETRSSQALRALWHAVGEEAVSEWCVGILAAFWPQEVLRSAVHGSGVRCQAQPKRGLVNVALSRSQAGSAWSVRDLWEAGCDGCPPQGWQPPEQLAAELGSYLSRLPYSPSPAERFLHDMWGAAEGARLLREALSAVQEARRSACGEGQPVRPGQVGDGEQSEAGVRDAVVRGAEPRERILRQARSTGQARSYPAAAVRRLVPEEAEALQGFPRGYTLILYRGRPAADGPRYRSLGNSFAVPVLAWIGARIAAQEAEAARLEAAA